ncbi:gluconokinase [Deinococcus roseus]|nr:gluconokinase [Deinococcus roseus]
MNAIGLDLGTTGCKAVLIDAEGNPLRSTYRSYPLIKTEPGEATQNAEVIWKAVQEALLDLKAVNADGLSFSGAMHSLLLVDGQNKPLAPALTWADTRPLDTLADIPLEARATYLKTGAPLKTPYHPAKITYLQKKQPALFAQAHQLVSIKDYIAFQLTGVWKADIGLASSSGLLNLHTGHWDEDIVKALQVKSLLPEVLDATDLLGNITPDAATHTGLKAGMPVFAGSSDGGLANLGTGAGVQDTVITVGTSGAVRSMVTSPQLDARGRTWCYFLSRNQMFAGGAINNAGLLIDWVRRMCFPADTFEVLFKEAAEVPDSEGLLLLPYLTGERSPHWKSDLTATLHGLALQHTRGHIARAALEAVCFSLAEVHDLVSAGTTRVLVTGNITRSPLWMQVLSNVLNRDLVVASSVDASALGAAMVTRHALDNRLGELTYKVQYALGFAPQPEEAALLRATREHWRGLFTSIWKEL